MSLLGLLVIMFCFKLGLLSKFKETRPCFPQVLGVLTCFDPGPASLLSAKSFKEKNYSKR